MDKSYVAWINGMSVACGSLAQVEQKAREIIATPDWQQWGRKQDGTTTVRITRGARQLFVKAYVLR